MRRIFYIVFFIFAVLPQVIAQQIDAQVREGRYVELRWHDVSGTLEIMRRMPRETGYSSLGEVEGSMYRDTVKAAVCGDTIHYRLMYGAGQSIETAVWFADGVPPQYSDIQIVTVDTLTDSIVVSWYPSESEDVAGYIICTGSPCVSPDTVYGTRYAVAYQAEPITFRVFAIDSCGNPSQLSPPCNNLSLRVRADSCGGTVTAQWNDYRNMPGGMGKYCLYYSAGRPYEWRVMDSTASKTLRFAMPEGADDSCYFRMSVRGLESGLNAYSNTASVATNDTSNTECSQSQSGDIDAFADMFALPNAIIYGQPPNDRFQPCATGSLPQGVSEYRLDIYCRTGRRVFRSEDPSEAFTGRRGTQELQGGAYVYLLFYSVDGVQQVKKGQLLLLK